MKSIAPVLLVFSVLALAGCNAINRTQYRIGASEPATAARAVVSPADREAVKVVLQSVAQKTRLRDMTQTTIAPNLIVYYQQPESENPVKLFAWTRGNEIVVDLMQGPSTPGTTRLYQAVRDTLAYELKQAFGSNVGVVPFPQELRPATDSGR